MRLRILALLLMAVLGAVACAGEQERIEAANGYCAAVQYDPACKGGHLPENPPDWAYEETGLSDEKKACIDRLAKELDLHDFLAVSEECMEE